MSMSPCPSTVVAQISTSILLRGTIVNRTSGIHKNLPGMYLPIFTDNIRSYLLWPPVIVVAQIRSHMAGSPPPSPPRTVRALRFCRDKTAAHSPFVGSHLMAPLPYKGASQQMVPVFIFANIVKDSPHWDSNSGTNANDIDSSIRS